MFDVFLSYSQHDREQVQRLVTALIDDGLRVWWDREILPGERISAVIDQVLEGVPCVLVAWSEYSKKSDWVPDEAACGRDHDKLVQVSVDGNPAPLGYQQRLTQDLAGWTGDPKDQRIQ